MRYSFSEERILRLPKTANYSMVICYIPLPPQKTPALMFETEGETAHWFALRSQGERFLRLAVVNALVGMMLDFATRCGITNKGAARGGAGRYTESHRPKTSQTRCAPRA